MRQTMLLAVAMLLVAPAFAQDEPQPAPIQERDEFLPQFELGDQMITTGVGMLFPLFFSGGTEGVAETNLSLGGIGSLRWASYLNNDMSIGGEVSGSFSLSPNGRVLYLVPLSVRYTYYLRSYPFEFPLHIGLGTSVSRLDTSTKVDPAILGGVEALWNYDSQWAFGLRAQYWLIPQIYFGGDLDGENRLGNFLSLTAIARYHI
ncbi:MAG: TP0733 family outer membrane beta-barrel protein [Spirochaetaceae bacterium]